jgi:hypothetical protein
MGTIRILRERIAGQSSMSTVIQAQERAVPRRLISRIFGSSPLTVEGRAHYRSALGEVLVGEALGHLDPSWDVLHDLPLSDGVLDHLVIGRPGVFTISAANVSRLDVSVDGDVLLVAGAQHEGIDQAKRHAAETAALLETAAGAPVPVTALLVVVDPRRVTVRAPAHGVQVIESRDLQRFLTHSQRRLTGDEVARISDLADLDSTWPRTGALDLDTRRLRRDFLDLRDAVRQAILRRVLWIVAAFGVSYVVLWSLVATLVSDIVHP